MHTCVGAQGGKKVSEPLEFKLQFISCLTWAMGIKLRSADRAVHTQPLSHLSSSSLLFFIQSGIQAYNDTVHTSDQSRYPSQTCSEVWFHGESRFSQADKITLHKPYNTKLPDLHHQHQLEKGRSSLLKLPLLKVHSKISTKTLVPTHLFSSAFKPIWFSPSMSDFSINKKHTSRNSETKINVTSECNYSCYH